MYAPNLSRSGELREEDLPSSYADWAYLCEGDRT